MARSLSVDLRRRVVGAIEGGSSCRAAAQRFGVGASSAIRWRAQERREGDIRPKLNRFVCTNPVSAKSARRCAGERQKADQSSPAPLLSGRSRNGTKQQYGSSVAGTGAMAISDALSLEPPHGKRREHSSLYGPDQLDYSRLNRRLIGSKIVNKTGEGLILDIILGVVGAVLGGYLFNLFGARSEFMESARSSDWINCRPYDLQIGDRRRTPGPASFAHLTRSSAGRVKTIIRDMATCGLSGAMPVHHQYR
jgi:transposase-like protein